MQYTVTEISPPMLKYVWPSIHPFVEKLSHLSRGRIVTEQVGMEFLNAHKTLWVVYDENMDAVGFVGASSTLGGNDKILNVDYLGGKNLSEWAGEADAVVTAHAEATGHSCIRFETFRAGWKKMIELFEGVKPVGYIYEKDLTDGREKRTHTHNAGRSDNDQ